MTLSSFRIVVNPETRLSRGAMARVALASSEATISDKQGSNDRADANKTTDVSVISCAIFLAVM